MRRRKLYHLDANDVLAFAKLYADLGFAVQDQVHMILDNPCAPCNYNAITLISDTLGGYNAELDDAIAEWFREYEESAHEKGDDH